MIMLGKSVESMKFLGDGMKYLTKSLKYLGLLLSGNSLGH